MLKTNGLWSVNHIKKHLPDLMALFINTKSSCSFINRTSVRIRGNHSLEQWVEMWLPHTVGQKEQDIFFLAKVLSLPHLNHPFAFSSQVSLCWTPVLAVSAQPCWVLWEPCDEQHVPWAGGPGCPCPWLMAEPSVPQCHSHWSEMPVGCQPL